MTNNTAVEPNKFKDITNPINSNLGEMTFTDIDHVIAVLQTRGDEIHAFSANSILYSRTKYDYIYSAQLSAGGKLWGWVALGKKEYKLEILADYINSTEPTQTVSIGE